MPTNGRRSEVSSSEDVTVAQESELAPEAEADVLPERVGPYRIVEQIARGGMGVVYRARGEDGGEVALKTVLSSDSQLRGRLRREVRALRRLDHPGIIRVLDEGLDEVAPWYAMELLKGSTLRNRLDAVWARHWDETSHWTTSAAVRAVSTVVVGAGAKPLVQPPESPAPFVEAGGAELPYLLDLAARISDALAFLHGEGIVHRDLKPSNVLVRLDGAPVVADFGLVGQFAGSVGRETLEVDEAIIGSVPYMAPEQLRGELVDARSDLYSLGCMLFECTTGRLPFRARSMAELRQKHLDEPPPPPSSFARGVPAELEALILALLEKRPRDRLGHARDVAAVLRSLASELGHEVTPPVGPEARAYLYRPELCGREELVERIESELVEVLLGAGRAVFLGGESGVGKTRVVLEAARRASSAGCSVVPSECAAIGAGPRDATRAAPLNAFRPLLRHLADGASDELEELLQRSGPVLARYEPVLGLLSAVASAPAPRELAADAERLRVFTALADVLATLGKDRPLLLVIDDLQWADDLSLAFIEWLGQHALGQSRVLLLGTYRSEEMEDALASALSAHPDASLRLARLSEGSIEHMVAGMLGIAQAPERFVASLARASEGNPFFVAEYLRAAIMEGLLFQDAGGRWQLENAERVLEDAVGVPHSVQELALRRLDRLNAAGRRLVELLSVVGREVEWQDAHALWTEGEELLVDAARELSRHQIVSEDDAGRLCFVHDKLREVAYARIDANARRALHGDVGVALERRVHALADSAAWSPMLAHHFERAGEVEKAVGYMERAAVDALRAGAPRAAVTHLERALGLASEDENRVARWHRLLGDAHYVLGDLPTCTEHCLSALEALGERAPRSTRGWLSLLAENGARRALRRSGQKAAMSEGALAAQRIAERYYFTNDALRIIAASLLAVNLAEQAGIGVPRAHYQLGIVAGVTGLHRLAERYFRHGDQSAEQAEDDYGLVMGAYTQIAYYSGVARWDQVDRVARRALPVAERLGDRQELDVLNTVIANRHTLTGGFRESAAQFAAIEESGRSRENPVHEAWGAYARSVSLVALGRHDEAVSELTHALALLDGRSDVASEIISYGTLAWARFRQGQWQLARSAADQGRERITSRMPAVYSTLFGYHGVTETYLRLGAAAHGTERNELLRSGKECLFRLRLFAQLMPMGRPAAELCSGLLARARGRLRGAHQAFARSAEVAQRLAMPYYEARALVESAALLPRSSPERRRLVDRAVRLTEPIGSRDEVFAVVQLNQE
ncbi:MAG: protein kinase [Myxococcales bacterium]|nr:protein kinase [Myxococcales bacterium]MCB9583056.1 protein kinase [Polyangiaceae bacterium]